jgi:hypothetical protein
MTSGRRTPASGDRVWRGSRSQGVSLIETVVTVGLLLTLVSVSVPAFTASREHFRASGAASHVAALVYEVRSRAIQRGRSLALRFTTGGSCITYAIFSDGNRNGIRTMDISRGIDTRVSPEDCLSHHFPGVDFGVLPETTDIETGAPVGGNGLRIGSSNLLAFGPDGSVTSGTLYVRGRGGFQYAVRMLGATGRVRVLRFVLPARTWETP